jgi:fibronectin type III domain protein
MPLLPRLNVVLVAMLTLVAATPSWSDPPTSAVTLEWTAPGDDGRFGRAQAYVLRYSTEPITDANFDQASTVPQALKPRPSGTLETFTVEGLEPDTQYYFALKAVDDAGNWSPLSNVAMTFSPTPGPDGIPEVLSFSAPWPNPAGASVRWAFALPQVTLIEVEAFGVDGRRVRRIANAWHPAGRGEIAWDLRDDAGHRVAAGIYLVRARLGTSAWSARVSVVR